MPAAREALHSNLPYIAKRFLIFLGNGGGYRAVYSI
jgi:hypothetical protein